MEDETDPFSFKVTQTIRRTAGNYYLIYKVTSEKYPKNFIIVHTFLFNNCPLLNGDTSEAVRQQGRASAPHKLGATLLNS